ncbi:MAG: immunity 22 family protein, partial [Acidimicrobiales bacterium]
MAHEDQLVWVGSFASAARFSSYVDERLNRGEGTPLSEFAQDQGETWYDHDWIEVCFGDSGPVGPAALIRRLSFSDRYASSAIAEAERQRIGPVNGAITINASAITNPTSVSGVGYDLHFLGSFDPNDYEIPTFDPSATAVSLRGKDLSSVPAEVFGLANLETLDLADNDLTALPADIGQLSRLKILRLYDNRIASLPHELFTLPALEQLDLRNNRLEALPPAVGHLVTLTSLMIGNNQISSLPSALGRLTNLTALGLEQNRLTELPPQIGELINLT